jgi:Lipase (class 3)
MPLADLLTYAKIVSDCYNESSAPTWQDGARLTHVYQVTVNGITHFNFQGTLDPTEWVNRDFDILGFASLERPLFGPLHDGFTRGALAMVPLIAAEIQGSGALSFTIGGHSKGAGEAQIAAAELKRLGFPAAAVYLFEPPRAGTAPLKAYLADIPIFATQTFNAIGADPVTEVPAWPWVDAVDPLRLRVPDGDDIATKHKIPAVIAALQEMSAKPCVA